MRSWAKDDVVMLKGVVVKDEGPTVACRTGDGVVIHVPTDAVREWPAPQEPWIKLRPIDFWHRRYRGADGRITVVRIVAIRNVTMLCPQCSTTHNVTKYEKGNSYNCLKCQQALSIPLDNSEVVSVTLERLGENGWHQIVNLSWPASKADVNWLTTLKHYADWIHLGKGGE